MTTIIPQNSQQRIVIPSEPGKFLYTLEQDAQLTLIYEPSYFDSLEQSVVIELNGDNSSLELYGLADVETESVKLNLQIIHRGRDTDAVVQIKGWATNYGSPLDIRATIRVESGATGTDTYYQADFIGERFAHDHDEAGNPLQIVTQPNLEIHEADIVNAGHGSSVGRIDENQIQYLEGRGLTREQAKSTLVDAFLADMREKMKA